MGSFLGACHGRMDYHGLVYLIDFIRNFKLFNVNSSKELNFRPSMLENTVTKVETPIINNLSHGRYILMQYLTKQKYI